MSSINSTQVLIVGSGPAGLVSALTLLKNGVPVRIIEKDIQHHVSERGAGVSPRTLEIEYFLEVGDEVRSSGVEWPYMQFFDPQDPHRIIKSFPMVEKIEPTPAFPIADGVMIGQWLHQQILRKHIESLGGHVELGCTLSGFEQGDDGVVVHLTKTKTTTGEQTEENAKFAYVIGADGAHSAVRKQLGVNFVGESREERIYLVDAHVEGMKIEKSGFYSWGDSVKNMAFLRSTTREDIFQMVLSGENTNYDILRTGTPEAVQSEFHKITGRTDLKITQVISHGEWRPSMRIAERFHDKRVFIVGDAAHVHPPTGGQGLNSSIQDSFNLAWKLALVLKNQSAPSGLLDTYEHERMPVIAEMLNLTTGLFHKLVTNTETQKALQDAKDISSSEKDKEENTWVRGRKFLQLDINYRWSEIVFDERLEKREDITLRNKLDAYGIAGRDIHAGDRAPDAPGLIRLTTVTKEGEHITTRLRLFDIFTPSSHTALIFSSDPSNPSTRAMFNALTADNLVRTVFILPSNSSSYTSSTAFGAANFVFRDAEDHAYKAYGLDAGAEQPTTIIVRPDAMIGAFARTADGVNKYISIVLLGST